MSQTKSFQLSPIGAGVKWFFALILLLPVAIALLILWHEAAAFSAMPGWALGLLIALGPAAILGAAMAARNPNVVLDAHGLRIKASFINKQWALSELERADACLVNLDARLELRPKRKLWGAAMPGLSSGIFKLDNGDKAHVYITDKARVVYIPTQSGPILLSLLRPKEFLDSLQAMYAD